MNEVSLKKDEAPNGFKTCPCCRGMIANDASVCNFCGEEFTVQQPAYPQNIANQNVMQQSVAQQNVMQQNVAQQNVYSQNNTKFCKHCGGKIPHDAVICTLCGRQVEELKQSAAPQPQVIVNNTNTNMNTNINAGGANLKNKWVAFWLCFFFGGLGIHKFYEGKILMGIIYFFTVGFFGIGSLIDLIRILLKPKYYQP